MIVPVTVLPNVISQCKLRHTNLRGVLPIQSLVLINGIMAVAGNRDLEHILIFGTVFNGNLASARDRLPQKAQSTVPLTTLLITCIQVRLRAAHGAPGVFISL